MICQHPRIYFCPQSGEDECPDCGGFDVCCARPEDHLELSAGDMPPATLRYWPHPRNWWLELQHQIYLHDIRRYCTQHDRIHWAWTHRRCGCWRRDPKAVRAVRELSERLNRGRDDV